MSWRQRIDKKAVPFTVNIYELKRGIKVSLRRKANGLWYPFKVTEVYDLEGFATLMAMGFEMSPDHIPYKDRRAKVIETGHDKEVVWREGNTGIDIGWDMAIKTMRSKPSAYGR